LLSLSIRRVDETKTRENEEVDKYFWWYMFKCWNMFVILRSYKSCRQSVYNFFCTPGCFCYGVGEMLANKWFIRFWKLCVCVCVCVLHNSWHKNRCTWLLMRYHLLGFSHNDYSVVKDILPLWRPYTDKQTPTDAQTLKNIYFIFNTSNAPIN